MLVFRLSGAIAIGVRAAILQLRVFPEGVAVHPEELNKFFRPLLARVVLRDVAPAPVDFLLF
jgi:hypothetical protein